MRFSSFIICSLFTIAVFGQKGVQDKADKLLRENIFHKFKLEKFFLHTNKSTYFTGEKIWFKAYIVDDDLNTPFLETTNLHINIYGPDKSLVESLLFFVDKGTCYGQIDLPEDLESGTYYLELDTEWNRNFKDGTVFKVEIKNLKQLNEETENPQVSSNHVSLNNTSNQPIITFFPESNTMLKDVQNMVSFSTSKNISGKIINSASGQTVASLRSNEYGIGAFKVMYDARYSAVLNIDDKEVQVDLPNAVEKGFIVHKRTSNYNSKTVNFELKTNRQTINGLDGKNLFAVLHRNGSVKSVAPIELSEEVINYPIIFLAKDVFNGINTITIFNEQNQPVSERHFFWKTRKNIPLEVTKGQMANDSLNINFRLVSDELPANLSISVLPKQTKVYKDDYSILSSFLISPYIQGNGGFINDDKLNSSYLDFLLQTQTFHQAFPYKNKSDLIFKNENGISIKGKVNTEINDPGKYSVMLTSKDNNILLVQPLNSDKSFEFNNLLLSYPTQYQLALLNKKGEIEKAKFFVYKNYTNYKSNPKINQQDDVDSNHITSQTNELSNEEFDLSMPQWGDVEELDEVVIKADRIKREQETSKELRRSGVQGIGFSRVYRIDDSSYSKGDILQYLRTLSGVTVKYTQDNTPYLNNERFLKTLNNTGDAPLTIILDGTPLGTDLSIINFRMASEFEYVIVNHRGAGYGALYPKGVINFVTKKGSDGKPPVRENPDMQHSATDFGFSIPESQFQNPFFQFPTYKSKENFKALDWVPNFIVDPNKFNTLKVNVEDANGVKLIINGMNDQGALFHQVIDMD